ncbi:disease resistance protein RPM1-like [Typha angustifolia]|uniref:disease resistance protein RPM1-like n=1 Tax=Typha angustifolia TaxID=59011 RepID=UPI003C2BFFBB
MWYAGKDLVNLQLDRPSRLVSKSTILQFLPVLQINPILYVSSLKFEEVQTFGNTNMLDAILVFVIQEITSAVISEAVRGLGSVLRNARLTEVGKEFDEIKSELESMQGFLEDAEKMKAEGNSLDKSMVIWIDQVKKATYKVEDIFDELMDFIHSHGGGGLVGLGHNFLHHPADRPTSYHIAKEIQEVKAQIRGIPERCERYKIWRQNPPERIAAGSSQTRREEPFFDEDESIMGIEKNRELLFEWLMGGEQHRVIVSVHGMGGLGKTTLAREVYNHPRSKKHFESRAWLSVSESWSIEELLRRLAEELLGGMMKGKMGTFCINTMDMTTLTKEIKECLSQKRYLIVIDDVWQVRVWDELSHYFPNNDFPSRILLTTRNRDIASSLSRNCLALEGLRHTDACALFFKATFKSSSCPKDLQHWCEEIIKKCKGLPLAIMMIGRLMSSKQRTAFEWKRMCQYLQWELSNNEILKPMERSLMLSYNHLPYYLKRCFLYCALFPEDYPIKTNMLIKLWIAEGFIEETQGPTLEEIAENYLDQLISRSMLQVAKRSDTGRPKACRVHDLMRELALAIAKGENLCMVEPDGIAKLKIKPRRLSLLKSIEGARSSSNLAGLRTLHVFTSDLSFSSLKTICSGFKLLRVLNLRGVPITEVPPKIFGLFNLRYLSLRETNVEEVPSSLEKLYNLQTLDLWKTKVKQLPREVIKLQNLRHLFVEDIDFHKLKYLNVGGFLRGNAAPSDIGDLKQLQTLRSIQADNDVLTKLGNLTKLRSLGVTRLDAKHGIIFCNCVSKMEHLHRLSIKASTGQNLRLDNLSPPPPQLQKLILNGRLGNVPQWFSLLRNLTHLYLFGSRLSGRENQIPYLPELQNLVCLVLDEAYDSQWLHFQVRSYENLKTLCLVNMSGLNGVVIDKGALRNLQVLHLHRCKNLNVLSGIDHLSAQIYLKELDRFDYPQVHRLPNVRILRK